MYQSKEKRVLYMNQWYKYVEGDPIIYYKISNKNLLSLDRVLGGGN